MAKDSLAQPSDSIPSWGRQLQFARKELGLTREQFAARANISAAAVRAYETNRRNASRAQVEKLVAALEIDRGWGNRILVAAGFTPDGLDRRPDDVDAWWYTPEEAAAAIEQYEWPAFVLSERTEVLSANTLAQKLWGVDMRYEYLDPVERNLLSVATTPRFADHVANWDEALTTIVRGFKNYHHGGGEFLESPTPYFAAVLKRFLEGDPKYVGRLLSIWQNAPDTSIAKIRWTYRVVWDDDEAGRLQFRSVVSPGNESDGISFNDWIPLDDASWRALEAIRARPLGSAAT